MPSPRLEWVVASCVAGWATARLTAADRFRSLERVAVPLLSLTPQAAAAAGLAALALRGKRPSATAGLAAAALTAVVVPRAIPRRQPAAAGPELSVLTVNLQYGRAAGEGLVRLVRRTGADVLFLQELTGDAVTRLKLAGLGELLPSEMLDVEEYRYRGSGIYARYPLRDGLVIGPSYASQPTARLDLPSGQAVQLVCVHPHPPMPPWNLPSAPRWRAELGALPARRPARGARGRLQRHARSRAVPPAVAPRPRGRGQPGRPRAGSHLGAGAPRPPGPACVRPRPGRPALRRARRLRAPGARQRS